jgi:hypothetical protein
MKAHKFDLDIQLETNSAEFFINFSRYILPRISVEDVSINPYFKRIYHIHILGLYFGVYLKAEKGINTPEFSIEPFNLD